jgi:enoyl-CoA hydratase
MDFKNIVYSKSEGIATIKFNRPDTLNALSVATWTELNAALDDAETDRGIKVLILTGEGKAFSSGDDISEFAEVSKTKVSSQAFVTKVLSCMVRVEKMTKPVIAAVNGLAMGGGCELVLASDIVIASDKAKFGLPEARIGAIAGFAVHRLPPLVGAKKAMELLLTCDSIDANEACRIGIVSKVVPADKLEAEARIMAKKITQIAPLAATGVKSLINSDAAGKGITESIAAGTFLLATDDFKEGFDAFLNKRAPVYKGN